MNSYFIRYTDNPQADLERGYSFVGYVLMDTAAKMYEFHAEVSGEAFEDDFDLDTYISDNPGMVAQDNISGKYGVVRSGLCGYGPYTSIEAAQADIASLNDQYAERDYVAIYEGKETMGAEDGQDDGVTFAPISIVYSQKIN